MNRPGARPDLAERFRAVVARGIIKADQAHAEHLASLRGPSPDAERRRNWARQASARRWARRRQP
jgi:hypothetical protein